MRGRRDLDFKLPADHMKKVHSQVSKVTEKWSVNLPVQEMVERTVKINISLRNRGRMSEICLRKGENSVKRNKKESILNSSISAVSHQATSD